MKRFNPSFAGDLSQGTPSRAARRACAMVAGGTGPVLRRHRAGQTSFYLSVPAGQPLGPLPCRTVASSRADGGNRIVRHLPLGPFWNTLFSSSSTVDLWGSILKTTLFGAIICCYKATTPSGDAEGVGRAVNQAIATTFLAIGAFNYVFTQTLLATHPNILVLK